MDRQRLILAICFLLCTISAAPTADARLEPAAKLKAPKLSKLAKLQLFKASKAYKAYKARKTSSQAAAGRRSLPQVPDAAARLASSKVTKPSPPEAKKTGSSKTALTLSPPPPSPPPPSPPPQRTPRTVGGWSPVKLPDTQATQLAGLAAQKYLTQPGLAATAGCSATAKRQYSAPVIVSGRTQVIAGMNMEVNFTIQITCAGSKTTASTLQLHASGFFPPGPGAPTVKLLPP